MRIIKLRKPFKTSWSGNHLIKYKGFYKRENGTKGVLFFTDKPKNDYPYCLREKGCFG